MSRSSIFAPTYYKFNAPSRIGILDYALDINHHTNIGSYIYLKGWDAWRIGMDYRLLFYKDNIGLLQIVNDVPVRYFYS